ncbi:hypothetical protein B0H17DRAFT_1135533 [Mycena rosella]|uniref:Uncharacterized protein n=1 Tax=Mycena rosella TaxID=1033263 RepID=A0AAD7DCN9_MYCRO|nr:hypothetical protein B0H17DRAFT_1135533 [Mycena rosella]
MNIPNSSRGYFVVWSHLVFHYLHSGFCCQASKFRTKLDGTNLESRRSAASLELPLLSPPPTKSMAVHNRSFVCDEAENKSNCCRQFNFISFATSQLPAQLKAEIDKCPFWIIVGRVRANSGVRQVEPAQDLQSLLDIYCGARQRMESVVKYRRAGSSAGRH